MIYAAQVELLPNTRPYEIHQYLYGYFPQHIKGDYRPFLFRAAGNQCLMVSRIKPSCPYKEISLESGRTYAAEGLLVPVDKRRHRANGKLIEIPITSYEKCRDWFMAACSRFGGCVGFNRWEERYVVSVRHINGHQIPIQPMQVKAMIMVTNPELFSEMLLRGLGRRKAFGYGLLCLHEVML